jgi:hypothetical protein
MRIANLIGVAQKVIQQLREEYPSSSVDGEEAGTR